MCTACACASVVHTSKHKRDEPGFHFYGNPTLVQYPLRGLNHLTIQLLWEVVKRGTVVFLPVLVILDIWGRFLSLKAIIFTTW